MAEEPSEPVAEVKQAARPPIDAADPTMPPASLSFLLTTLATQAMVALGEIPNPITRKADVRPRQAQHFIDTLQVLETKTQGNRTPEETALLSSLLHQLRMSFIARANSGAK